MLDNASSLAFVWCFVLFMALLAIYEPRRLLQALTAGRYQGLHDDWNTVGPIRVYRGRAAVSALLVGAVAISSTLDFVLPYDQERLDALGRQVVVDYAQPDRSVFPLSVEEKLSAAVEGETEGQVRLTQAGSEVEEVGSMFTARSRHIDRFELSSLDDESVRGCLAATYETGVFATRPGLVVVDYSAGPC